MGRQLDLLPKPKRTPRVLMHVVDAGNGPAPGHWAEFECDRCGYRSEWRPVESITDAKRGLPCPKCNDSARSAAAELDSEGASTHTFQDGKHAR